jgi:SMC interacting uncharacterized protein involved in chromosome segregation
MNVSQETLLSVLATVATVGAAFGAIRAEIMRNRDEVREHRKDAKDRHVETQAELRGIHQRLAVVETMQVSHEKSDDERHAAQDARIERIEHGGAVLSLAAANGRKS